MRLPRSVTVVVAVVLTMMVMLVVRVVVVMVTVPVPNAMLVTLGRHLRELVRSRHTGVRAVASCGVRRRATAGTSIVLLGAEAAGSSGL